MSKYVQQSLQQLTATLLLLVAATTQADFITDKIVVEIYSQRFNQGPVLKKLSSGSQVEVLLNDGQYSRIRTHDNITGWIESHYLSKEKPSQLEHLELLSKTRRLEADLKTAQEKLASSEPKTAGIGEEELAQLRQQAKKVRWMRAEMTKARDRAQQLEKQIKSENKQSTESQQELEHLRSQKQSLEGQLAAILLVNKQQQAEADIPQEAVDPPKNPAAIILHAGEEPWRIDLDLKWLLIASVIVLIVGIFIGITWLDKRIRRRHGGFRLY